MSSEVGRTFYISAFGCRSDGELELIQEDRLFGKLDGWLKDATQDRDDFVVLGDFPDWFPDEASERHENDIIPDAGVMIEIGKLRHEKSLSVDAELALPIYVEGDSPWKKSTHTGEKRKIPLLFAPERFDDLEDYLPWCEVYELDQEAELELQSEVRLLLDGRGLGIALPAQKSYFYVSSIDIQARIKAGRRGELAKACLGNKDSMLVLDAFAGFGVDGLCCRSGC